jgi:hypothetical protein
LVASSGAIAAATFFEPQGVLQPEGTEVSWPWLPNWLSQ